MLLSQLWHSNQRACALFCTTLKHKATFQGWGEVLVEMMDIEATIGFHLFVLPAHLCSISLH